MNRRDFLKGMLAAAVAPAIVKAENIMRINPDVPVLLTETEVMPKGVAAMLHEYDDHVWVMNRAVNSEFLEKSSKPVTTKHFYKYRDGGLLVPEEHSDDLINVFIGVDPAVNPDITVIKHGDKEYRMARNRMMDNVVLSR